MDDLEPIPEPANDESSRWSPRRTRLTLIGTGVASMLATIAALALLSSIAERKREAEHPWVRVVEIDDDTVDPARWGQNFPHQYDTYQRTVDMQRTRFGGSEAVPRRPTSVDPRRFVSVSKLDEDPRLETLWAGYAFAVDYREKRGHAYMLDDQRYSRRTEVARQPGACIHCHASTWTAYLELGGGDPIAGFEAIGAMPYERAREHVDHPIACIDCHDPDTMALRITRPAFMRGIAELRGGDYDVNRDATRAQMRTYVCAQCHVEYHFEGGSKRLVYPWANGLKAEQILEYYDTTGEAGGFSDWTHARTGAPMLKPQHPEFELWSQGTHAQAGVSCVDCHMPYTRVGATKITDHQINSPMLKMATACQTCHRVDETQLRTRVERIQQRTADLEDLALDALEEFVVDLEHEFELHGETERVVAARQHQRRGTWYLDFVMAENSMGFHADQESARIVALGLEEIRRGQRVLHRGVEDR